MSKSNLEADLEWQIKLSGLPKPSREYRFSATRKFRADFAWPIYKCALECDGGLFKANSGHRSMVGVERDIEKHNEYVLSGWKYLRVTRKMVKRGDVVGLIEKLLRSCL